MTEQDEKLLLTEGKVREILDSLDPNSPISFGRVTREICQLFEQKRLDRPDREKIAELEFESRHPNSTIKWKDIGDIGAWKVECYAIADQILALIPDVEALDALRTQLTELNKKLDDREEDLIEAKREERERIRQSLKVEFRKATDETEANPFEVQNLNNEHRLLWRGHANACSEAIQYLNLLDRQALRE